MRCVDPATVHGRRLNLPQEICSVSLRRLREPRGDLTAEQKSAKSVVDPVVGEASEALQSRKVESTDRPSRERGSKARTRGEASRGMHLRNDKRQNIQKKLDFPCEPAGETRQARRKETESCRTKHELENPANTIGRMEEVCERENLLEALRRVRANKGSAGIDGRTVGQLSGYLKEHWLTIREELLNGTYEPQPVRRVEIPKPDGGGMRKLGIPITLDRFLQQAVMQVLQRQWDPTFSDHSYGFRPGRSAHQAVAQAQQYIVEGYGWVVDLDLEKFFDRVNHDKLMGQIVKRVEDKRLRKLIRAFLNAGVMENGLVSPSVEGTPQGGPLSPLLSNLVLDELDRELMRRGHRHVRYADDCNIYVRSERAGQRVMKSITRFITQKLKLSERDEERSCATTGAKVPRIQLYGRTRGPARRCAKGLGSF